MYAAMLFLLLWPRSSGQRPDEAVYAVNGRKALHVVDERFLSVSIDPAVLLTGLNLSETTLQMARRLAPAYVRIAGPSTRFVAFREESRGEAESGTLVVTPTMWFGINEWLSSAGLSPVFGVNDRGGGRRGWSPREEMGLLETSDKLNVSCYWQLGYDCSNKTEERYKNDVRDFRQLLDSFPDKKDRWRIVASDPSFCVNEPTRVLDEMADVLAAAVQEAVRNDSKPQVPVWVTSPKSPHSTSFASAIDWAQQLGEAAKAGHEVVLRQPRLHEIFSPTPPFWVSVLHKMLVGRHVLEARAAVLQPDLTVYAHCARHQNDYVRSGAMTVFAVNNGTTNRTILLKFGTFFLKNTEVQSYVLSAQDGDAKDVLLNGEKLSLSKFSGERLNVPPKLRRARIMNYLSLFLPPKSVGFFVLPDSQIPVCASEETDLGRLIEEIEDDQNIDFSEEKINARLASRTTPSLREMQRMMEEELESGERRKPAKNEDFLFKRTKNRENEDEDGRRGRQREDEGQKRMFDLELTSAEIRRLLSDRAKARAARKNIIFTSEELDEIMDKATQKFLNNKNASIRIRKKSKRETPREDKYTRILAKRDINMDLLKMKTETLHNNKNTKSKKKFESNEAKQATIRESGQTSDEFLDFEDEGDGSPLPDRDVFAELAESDDVFLTTTTEKTKHFKLRRPLASSKAQAKPALPKIELTPLEYDPEARRASGDDFEVAFGGDIEDSDEDFDCIHEYFGKQVADDAKNNRSMPELWEMGVKPFDEESNNRLPSLAHRTKHPGSAEGTNSEGSMFAENDYEDLESDEDGPMRSRRGSEMPKRKKPIFVDKSNRYKSLTEGLRTWKPSDILTLKQTKVKRSVDHDVGSVENEIGEFLKNAELVGPAPGTEQRDYQLIFPNKDKIEVVQSREDTEMKLVLHGNSGDHAVPRTEEATTISHIQRISKENSANLWNTLLKKVTDFFQGLGAKLKRCIVRDLVEQYK